MKRMSADFFIDSNVEVHAVSTSSLKNEDLNHGQLIEGKLKIINPFVIV